MQSSGAHTQILTEIGIQSFQLFAVKGVAIMTIFALIQDAVLKMRDVGNEGIIAAV